MAVLENYQKIVDLHRLKLSEDLDGGEIKYMQWHTGMESNWECEGWQCYEVVNNEKSQKFYRYMEERKNDKERIVLLYNEKMDYYSSRCEYLDCAMMYSSNSYKKKYLDGRIIELDKEFYQELFERYEKAFNDESGQML